MASTGEADRKRRHVSSISPTAATMNKPSSMRIDEDKKLNAAVLQFQNQMLFLNNMRRLWLWLITLGERWLFTSRTMFLSQLLETGATESSSAGTAASQIEEDSLIDAEKSRGSSQHIGPCDLKSKVNILRLAVERADIKYLRGELETTAAGLEESNCKLAILKAERAGGKG
ncbi:unnamed protein product [Fraxinus pennsylvanica]|uniref:Uncharacterized protein n=1 Tax=Fraxinus pennsylvanica TaxID=56036 RepID=A0AAD2A8C4_9LAMI|nr:unnamed protein product [Fraxinus pennsylvanica]